MLLLVTVESATGNAMTLGDTGDVYAPATMGHVSGVLVRVLYLVHSIRQAHS